MNILTTTPVQSHKPIVTGRYACLVQIHPAGEKMGQRHTLGDTPIVIGRSDRNDIAIPDISISRKHARIEPAADGVCVTDLVSTNGTYINDRLVKGTEVIRDGDYLRIGNTIFRFLAGGNMESEYHEEIYRLTIRDALTHLHNRRYLVEFLDRELIRTVRHSRPLAFLLFDLDRFKTINDRFGQLAGDSALRELAGIVGNMLRPEDLLTRYDGEEFGVVLVETAAPAAQEFAERLRQTIERHTFHFEKEVFNLTVSVGVVSLPDGSISTTKEVLQIADRRLREAKNAGRNRVVDGASVVKLCQAYVPEQRAFAQAV
jgi:two-component system, cell cycle response regulator